MSWYRIRAVSEIVGVSTATLRAWERRYGVPTPARTASAYRLYGDADVQTIRKMRDLVQHGMAPAEAARQVLSEHPAPPAGAAADEPSDPYALACDRIVEATVQFDPDNLQLEVSRALTLGPSISIFERTLAPALQHIGDLWHDGTITIAQEHLASQVLLGTLSDLLRLAQPADASRRVALACFADEEHALSLYGVALRFTSWGFRTVMIGARTPPPAIGRVVETLIPDVVALSATITPPPPRARELVDAYADACRGTTWIVGGQAAESMRSWIEKRGGLVASATMSEIRKQVDKSIVERRRHKH
ncbi:Transcriptional regulator, MerR family protein [Minicystis rosea]|nr:Transcriptional regulator, MerR family protein [Minicystis rosea]